MLRFLSIKNLAVIEAVDIEFESGLNVLTGETGAGKSILVEAVNLLLGGRASPDLIRTGQETATVQAIFDAGGGEDLVVRREITSAGRSRGFINGALATAAGLRELAVRLVDLHGQHEHQALLDPDAHLGVLDEHAGLGPLRDDVAGAFEALQQATRSLDRTRAEEAHKTARAELVAFQLSELDRARLRAGEDEALATRRNVLSSAEKIHRLCEESYALLYDGDQAVLANLSHVWKRVGELAALDPSFSPYLDGRDAIKSQLTDLAGLLRGYAADLDASPAHLQETEDRLALLERLKRKHGPTLDDVLATQVNLRRELDSLTTLTERILVLEGERADAEAGFLGLARELSNARRESAPGFCGSVERELHELAMERCLFEVRFDRLDARPDHWSRQGLDGAEFFVSPNPGEDLRPLARIVSGGELSRLMLALKTLASTDQPGKTLIFDEVDAGIGGRVADAVGSKLRTLGRRFQVLCITHLPQIAAYGQTHFQISKTVRQGRTVTRVERLDAEGRVEEVARMIAGAGVSDGTRVSAREMLEHGSNVDGEDKTKGESERVKAKGVSRRGR